MKPTERGNDGKQNKGLPEAVCTYDGKRTGAKQHMRQQKSQELQAKGGVQTSSA